MDDFNPETHEPNPHSKLNLKTKLSADEVIAIAAAMQHVAMADGLHATERELIVEFVEQLGTDLGEELKLPDMTPALLSERLRDPEVRLLALQSLVLLAWADGRISDAEDRLNRDYATALGLSQDYPSVASTVERWVREGNVEVLFG